MAEPASPPDPAVMLRSRRFIGLLVVAAVVGVVVSVAAWGFLELTYYLQKWWFTDIPKDLGLDDTPLWWYPPVLAVAALLVAMAIVLLPGQGGHIPAEGLNPGVIQPIEVPGVIAAGAASIGFGMVIGPEAPLIAIGGGLGVFAARRLRGAGEEVEGVLSAAAAFAALGFLFSSPIIAAIILIEATGLGGPRLPLVLVPGLLASGIGSLTWIGLGSITGLSTSDISLGTLKLSAFDVPDASDFGWTILLAIGVAVVVFGIFRLARQTQRLAAGKPFLVLPAAGLLVSGLAIAFDQIADKNIDYVLFSGENSIDPLVANPGAWSLGALLLLVACKGLAYSVSLGSFRGGPVFPAIFLGAAGGLIAAQLPGYEVTPAVAVGIGAAVVSVLGLPLSATVMAVILTSNAGPGTGPLIILGVVVAHLVTLGLAARASPATTDAKAEQPPAAAQTAAPT